MTYLDTSVLVAYYCPEPLSDKAESLMTSQLQPSISALTEVEFFSALSKKVRANEMSPADAGRVATKFISHLDGHYYTRLFLAPHHYRLARDWIGQFHTSLRTLDALHLAVASSEGLVLFTADQNLVAAAEALSVAALLLTAD
jgi:predicted nucleic acid-binding protein